MPVGTTQVGSSQTEDRQQPQDPGRSRSSHRQSHSQRRSRTHSRSRPPQEQAQASTPSGTTSGGAQGGDHQETAMDMTERQILAEKYGDPIHFDDPGPDIPKSEGWKADYFMYYRHYIHGHYPRIPQEDMGVIRAPSPQTS